MDPHGVGPSELVIGQRAPVGQEASVRHEVELLRRAHEQLGIAYAYLGKEQEALAEFDALLALDPGLSLAYNNLGFAYGAIGAYEQAERSFRTSLGDAGALYNMALVYERRGESKQAASVRRRAFVQNPELRALYVKSQESNR